MVTEGRRFILFCQGRREWRFLHTLGRVCFEFERPNIPRRRMLMSRALSRLSVAQIEQVLEQQKSLLHQLTSKRDALISELKDLDKQIHVLAGKRGRGRIAKLPTGRRVRNEKSLRALLGEILAKHKKGLTKKELMEKVLASGYKSNAKNFGMIVYLNLYNKPEFSVDDKGVYMYHPEKAPT